MKISNIKKVAIVLLLIGAMSFAPEKSYKVELSLNEWQKGVSYLEYTKNFLKQSNLPANQVIPLTDSLSYLENEIITQLKVQLADTIGSMHGK